MKIHKKNGILLGSKDNTDLKLTRWPGYTRTNIPRDLSLSQVRDAVLLDQDALRRYGETGAIITDDNQLLGYGDAVYSAFYTDQNNSDENFLIHNNLAFIDTLLKQSSKP